MQNGIHFKIGIPKFISTVRGTKSFLTIQVHSILTGINDFVSILIGGKVFLRILTKTKYLLDNLTEYF